MENKLYIIKRDRVNFQDLREHGYRIQPNSWLVVYWDTNQLSKSRILWNLSRKIGNAVVRNRLKRWCREYIRIQLKDVLAKQGLDLNVAFRPCSKDFYKDLQRAEIDKELCRVEKKIRERLAKVP